MPSFFKPDPSLRAQGVLRSFGRIQARKLSEHKSEILERLLPQLHVPDNGWDHPNSLFSNRYDALALEIGFGAGEHLATQAKCNPKTAYIGCEPYLNGVAQLLTYIEQDVLENIRVWQNDARVLLSILPKQCLDTVYILFPDPWPKTRHHRRRLVQPLLFDLLAKTMKQGATLRIATDHPGYAQWVLAHAMNAPAFTWQATTPKDWKVPPSDWVETRYQQKALASPTTTYLHFTRI